MAMGAQMPPAGAMMTTAQDDFLYMTKARGIVGSVMFIATSPATCGARSESSLN
jgi:hypothetical protein